MKKSMLVFTTIFILGTAFVFSGLTVHAEGFDWQEYYEKAKAKREQREKESTEKWLDELEADGNLTQEAIDAAGKYGVGRTPNHKSRRSSGKSTGGSGSSGTGKGWVYSADELHVIGLPEGSNGYTKPGYYGDVDGSDSGYSGSGKGWVYSADELHVIGLPEGSNGYTKPGYYGDID